MQQRQLGRSGLYVSQFALGAMTFGAEGWGCDEQTATRLVHQYLDAGGSFVDTADMYGSSEDIVGRAIKGHRDEIVLATKVGLPMGPGPNDRGTSRGHILRACESSLRRLGTDHLDIYWIHLDDAATPLDETLGTLADLVHAGKVRYLGASNFHAYRLMKALSISGRLGVPRFVAFQGQYNLIVRTLEREHFRLLEEEGLGFVSWSPLGAGMLTGKVGASTGEPTRLAQRELAGDRLVKNDRGFAIAAQVQQIAAAVGCTPAQVALAWQRTRPVASVILGVRTPEQLADNLGALDVVIPPELLETLDAATQMPEEYPGAFIETFRGWLRGGKSLR